MSIEDQIKALEGQVAELFEQNRDLIRQVKELARGEVTPQQLFDAKALAQRIHRDGWDVLGKPKRGGRHEQKKVA